MKTMCPSCYHHNGFMAIHALGHMLNHTSCAQMHELPQGPGAKKTSGCWKFPPCQAKCLVSKTNKTSVC